MTIEVYKQIMWVHWKILFFRGGGGGGGGGGGRKKKKRGGRDERVHEKTNIETWGNFLKRGRRASTVCRFRRGGLGKRGQCSTLFRFKSLALNNLTFPALHSLN